MSEPIETPDAHAAETDRLVEPDDALQPIMFGDLPETLKAAATRAGWNELMPVQKRALPYILAKRDLMIQSRTGSGKTGAFMLPIIERIDTARDECQALILVPTRELAKQVSAAADTLCGDCGVRCAAVYGGVGYGPQVKALKAGAHIVVGTPGRILDHLLRKTFTLDKIDMLVFDEADRMLSMGFYQDMLAIRSYVPKSGFNGYLFSATFPPHVMRLAGRFLHKPELLSLSRDHVHVADTEHVYYEVPAMEKDRVLARIIEIENPQNAIVFCNTKSNVHYVTVVLQRFGYDADELSSDLSQNAREKVLARVRKGQLRFLVATDVAARGIDIPELSHVFQYDVPEDHEAYIHRAGRTGRAGATGEAVTLAAGMEIVNLRQIAKRYKIDFDRREPPTDEDVAQVSSERLTALLEARLRDRDNVQRERIERFIPLARELAGNDDESAIIAMLLDEFDQRARQSAPIVDDEPPVDVKPSGSSESKRKSGRRRRGGRGKKR